MKSRIYINVSFEIRYKCNEKKCMELKYITIEDKEFVISIDLYVNEEKVYEKSRIILSQAYFDTLGIFYF